MKNDLTVGFAVVLLAAVITPRSVGQTPTGAYDLAISQTAATTCPSAEAVALSGNLHLAYSFVTDTTTGINTYQIAVSSNLSGIGQATQITYAANASFAYGYPTTSSPAQITAQLQYPLSSQSSSQSRMTLNQTVNITVDTAGNISATVPSSSTTCAGS